MVSSDLPICCRGGHKHQPLAAQEDDEPHQQKSIGIRLLLQLDEATQKQLGRGKRLRELLKQPQFAPLNLAEQVAIVYAGVKGLIDEVPEDQVTQFARELREYLKTNKADFISMVLKEKVLSENAESILKDAINEVKSSMLAAA